jgi:predicted DNA binding CopG/RHH family protein
MKKEVHFRIRNINQDDYESLKQAALKYTGSPSPSALARYLINQKIKTDNDTSALDEENTTNRIHIRMPQPSVEKLREEAKANSMTLNQYIRLLLVSHLHKEALPSTSEVQALRDSNYQLYKIGVNLNQIAKALNTGSAMSLTTNELRSVRELIDGHFKKVGSLLQAVRRRT